MAREAARTRRHGPIVVSPQRKSNRIAAAQEFRVLRFAPAAKAASPIQRPIREATKTKNGHKQAKAKQIVSVAGIFKKKLKDISRSKKSHRYREPTPTPEELDLLLDFQCTVINVSDTS